jgi:phosphopantetheine--protein transferase-like protein
MKNELLKTVDELPVTGFAIGNDLVFLPDFETSLTHLFKKKAYTANEISFCDAFANSLLRYASTWAAKEAVYKALKQLSPAPLTWKKIEIIRDKIAGKPSVLLHTDPGKYQISLSISHDGDYVWALAFIQLNN